MRTWLDFDFDPFVPPRRLPLVGTSDWDATRLELVALASELAVLAALAQDDLHHLAGHDRRAKLGVDCERLESAAQEVLALAAVWRCWTKPELERGIHHFYNHLADARSVRAEISRLVARRQTHRR